MALGVSLRVAGRELRAGLSGFRVFLACLALGVAAIAAVGSISTAFTRGLAEEGRTLLGGDVEVELGLRDVTAQERAWLDSTGTVSRIVTMRANAVREDRTARRLISLKAVDEHYPFLGTVALAPMQPVQEALAVRDGVPGAAVAGTLLRRLDLSLGERIIIGTQPFEIRAEVVDEPDSTGGGFLFGPRVLISTDGLALTGLVQTGSLIDFNYRVLLPEPADDDAVRAWREAAEERFPNSDWQVRDRLDASPGARFFIQQVGVFLTFVGLTALVVGGVGVGNAVQGYLERKTRVIATLKCLGAPSGSIFTIYFIQVMAIAAVGILIGLVLGALAPFVVSYLYADALPIPARFDLYPQSLALAALYGLLVAIAFSVWPLARARDVPAAGLFRDLVAPARRWPRLVYVLLTVAALAGLALLAIFLTADRIFAVNFILGAAGSFLLLRLAGSGIAALARAVGRPRNPVVRLALANLYRPGAATGSIVLSLGLGLTLLVTVSLIDGNISAQVRDRLPDGAPAFFFVDIPSGGIDQFRQIVADTPGTGSLNTVPSLRGRITQINGVPADEAEIDPRARWALRGDRGVTYAREIPENSEVVAGEWWPADYDGPLLLSLDEDLAREFRIGLGDTLSMNVLGREFTAEISNLRSLDYETVGFNFIFVFSPGILERAPHTFVATVVADEAAEDPLENAVGEAFPNVSAVRVREALESINNLVADLALAVRGTSAVTLVAGVLVLAGAMAAGHRQRVYDASVLKVLGATRRRVLSVYLLEYGLVGFATAVFASLAGTLSAWLVITQVMQAPWVFLPGTVGAVILAATVVTIVLGLLGTYRSLSVPAAGVLRAE